MSKKRNFIFLSLLILGILLLTSCFFKPPVTEGVLKGQVIVPEGSVQTKDLTGQALPDATVNIIDLSTGDIIATTTTDANGYYQVFVPAGGPYLLQVVKDGVVILQITPQVEVGIEYDLGIADCSTTTVALIAQAMMDAGADLADINLADIEADPDFNDVMSAVFSAIEAGEDPTELAVVQQAVEDFLSPPPSPAPAPTPTYTVSFDKNDTGATGTMVAQTIASGSSANLTACGFTKTGWAFEGWAETPTGAVAYTDQASYTMGTADVTLYAKWTINTYTVTFNKNDDGVEGTMVAQTIASGSSANLTACAFIKVGWTFAGWATTSGGTVEYTDEASYTMGSANVTLYAKWTINTYTVTFDSQGGTAVVSQTVAHGGKATKPTAPTKTGYLFDGWYEESECINLWDFDTDTVIADVTLYAKWTIDRYVSKSGDDGNVGSADHPWLTIQHALDNAPSGGTIHVADGTYTENISFPSAKVIVLKSENGASSTEINGGNSSRVVTIDGCPDGTTLDGFTITGGNGSHGGGVYIYNCSPTIEDNTITGNSATYDSGGISIIGGSPTIRYNTISENSASGSGGGIYIHTCSPTIEYNAIMGNTATRGGGIYMHNSSSSIEDNTISGNTASGWGGGIYIGSGSPGPDIRYNTISVNTANTEGGGIYITDCSPNILGNTVCSNTLAQIYHKYNSYTTNNDISTHCGIIGETGPAGGFVFYDKGYVSDGWRYLEAAPSDESGTYTWSNIIDVEIGIFAQGTAIGTGQTNTTAIIGQTGHMASAAKLCDELIVGSYDDWFLPSEDELNLMYTNLYNEGVGGFAGGHHYWSSSEVTNRLARVQHFYLDGTLTNFSKSASTVRVRAVRAY